MRPHVRHDPRPFVKESRMRHLRPSALTRTLVLVLALMLPATLAATAVADTAVITFTDAGGVSDPVAGVGRTMTIAGNTAVPEHLYVKHRPAGGAPCAPSWSSDSGSGYFSGFSGDSFNANVNGNFTLKETGSWPGTGAELFCVWLSPSESSSVTPISQVITFRSPTGAISVAVTPLQAQPDQAATVTISGSSESPENVYATIRTGAGAPCSISYDADSGHGLVNSRSVSGAFSFDSTTTQSTPGPYTVCVWLAPSASSGNPIAGPQSATFTVLAPPPPCVVPVIAPGTTLQGAIAGLSAAHCALGRRTFTASRSYPRGTLIKLKTTSGTSLAAQATVDAVFSTGTPCRVPRLKPGTRLATAKARILAAGCTVGPVKRIKSHTHRSGIVLAYGPAPGTRLKPRATVAIVVSRGPGRRRHR
jgi:hypothetical protein